MVDFLKKCGAIGLLLISSMSVQAAEEGASGGSGAAGSGGALSVPVQPVA